MNADDYHKWWMASGIGLGHPLNDANSEEMKQHLSHSGWCIATLLHAIPTQDEPTSKNYFIGGTEADRALRWAEAAATVGADRLAAALRAEATHNYRPETASLLEPLRSYPDVESHQQLRDLIAGFAIANSDALTADAKKHGDHRGDFPTDPKKFHNAWLRLVDQKHEKLREDESQKERAATGQLMMKKISKLELLLAKNAMPQMVERLISELADAWTNWRLNHDLTCSPRADEWMSRLGKLIRASPEVFPVKMHPVNQQGIADELLKKLDACLTENDVNWCGRLGKLQDLLLEEIPGDRNKNRFLAHLIYRPLKQLEFRWGQACLQIDLGDFDAHAPLTAEFRTFVEQVISRATAKEQALSEALVADFFDRFHISALDDPFALYDDDVTAEQLLNDVGGITIQIQRYGDNFAAQAWFGVPWDDEHGVEVAISVD